MQCALDESNRPFDDMYHDDYGCTGCGQSFDFELSHGNLTEIGLLVCQHCGYYHRIKYDKLDADALRNVKGADFIEAS